MANNRNSSARDWKFPFLLIDYSLKRKPETKIGKNVKRIYDMDRVFTEVTDETRHEDEFSDLRKYGSAIIRVEASECRRQFQPASARVSSTTKTFPSGIKRLHSPDLAIVDIVFIHGLTGDREQTWTASGAIEPWPKTLLPLELPTARVLTFGYDASVADYRSVVSTNRIGNHAWNLLTSLASYREKDNTNERPIIFVCHSLGGLVCEDALVRSKERREVHLKSILHQTRGIVFLGTPHHGSGLAKWAKLISQSVGLIKQTNTEIIRVLERDSEVLARVQDSFHTMVMARGQDGLESIQMTCFYEELPMPGIGLVVPHESATLPGYIPIGIRGNHREMTKFMDIEDPGFTAVCAEIRRFIKDLGREQEQQARQATLGPIHISGKTIRTRGVPRNWDIDQLQSFLLEQGEPACTVVESLAPEINGRSSTATVTFKDVPPDLRALWPGQTCQYPLPKLDHNARSEYLTLDVDFLGVTTLFYPRRGPRNRVSATALILMHANYDSVVAITGLGGHAFGSFKERGGDHMWLRDALPYDLTSEKNDRPMARVMIYGYESAVAESTSMQNLEDLASSFHNSLISLAARPETRPIVFIAHSLGGLIIKQALISLAKSENEEDKRLLQTVHGVAFFGVPHDGMDTSSLIPMVGNRPNRLLIESIDRINSQILSIQQREFHHALGAKGDAEVFCFYETKLSPTAKQNQNGKWAMTGESAVLVTKSSATHCRSWEAGEEHMCAISRTHSDMVKFGRHDNEYDKVRDRLIRLTRWATTASPNLVLRLVVEVPYNENSDFVGPSEILAQLKQQLGFSQRPRASPFRPRVSLYGLGGVGGSRKTQIALAYVFWLHTTCPEVSVFWVPASSTERFRKSFFDIAQKCQIPGYDDPKLGVLLLAKNWLETNDRRQWLLVIDNANDTEIFFNNQSDAASDSKGENLARYLSDCSQGSLLITTRNKQAAIKLTKGEPPIKMGRLDKENCRALLRTRLEGIAATDTDLSTLSDRLEHLPLALVQAAAFVQENIITVQDYFELQDNSDQSLVDLLIEEFEIVGRDLETPRAVAQTWMISF
ncbi:hypothetical protein TrVFT333_006963 [Trichoderma virens FT-333]|nr:hypothetical protein TrVFT333_006963 [Trichoderma virens FT-333]